MPRQHDGGGQEDRLAPVVPLFGGEPPVAPPSRPGGADWHTTWRDLPSGAGVRPAAEPLASRPTEADDEIALTEDAERAEAKLMRALASRSLSESEARDRLRREGVSGDSIEDIVERLMRVGAIDDAALAEQVVYAAVTRKNEGRLAIGQALRKRGIARDVIDDVLAELPDDDAERALEFARSKAKNLVRLDGDTALRRLVGQLGRRGFGGGLAMSVARQALDEAARPEGGPRFC